MLHHIWRLLVRDGIHLDGRSLEQSSVWRIGLDCFDCLVVQCRSLDLRLDVFQLLPLCLQLLYSSLPFALVFFVLAVVGLL